MQNIFKFFLSLFSFCLATGFLSQLSFAQDYWDDYYEEEEETGAPKGLRDMSLYKPDYGLSFLGNDLMGDRIDPDSGYVTFTHTDVAIPGNSALPVTFSRTRTKSTGEDMNALGDWVVNVPRIETNVFSAPSGPSYIKWTPSGSGWYGWKNDRCSSTSFIDIEVRNEQFWGSGTDPSKRLVYYGRDYSNGLTVYSQTGSEGRMLGARSEVDYGASTPTRTTKSMWKISCISIGGQGQGFKAVTPDGTTYTYNVLREKNKAIYSSLSRGSATYPEAGPDTRAIMYASKVEDVHGNWVKYEYNQHGPTRIHSNDLREINISYSGSTISSVTANNRTWTYTYDRFSDVLEKVTRPDGTSWEFGIVLRDAVENYNNPPCDGEGYISIVKHPHGTVGEFHESPSMEYQGIKRAPRPWAGDVYEAGWAGCSGPENAVSPKSIQGFPILEKTLSENGAVFARWQYEYDAGGQYGQYQGGTYEGDSNENSIPDTKENYVINPDGT